MTLEELRNKLAPFGQEHLLAFWKELSPEGRLRLEDQIASLDLELIAELASRLDWAGESRVPEELSPPETISIPENELARKCAAEAGRIGLEVLMRGECAVMLVAGGQATRLGYDAPKGMFPIGPVTGRTLFQLHAEKIKALSLRVGRSIPWLVMTSPANDGVTRRFFKEHDFFALDPGSITFFTQGILPAVDASGRIILAEKDSIALSPDGHGGSLTALRASSCLARLKEAGVKHLFYFQVDNPLVPIPDPVFLGYHAQRRAQMSFKVVEKTDPWERVGVVVAGEGSYRLIEYSDLPEERARERDGNGRLTFRAGSIGVHLLAVPFIERLLSGEKALPYHIAHKKVPFVDETGNAVKPEVSNAYKFEKFIFDALAAADRSVIMEVRREREFAPVKNATGEDSPETARALLQNEWRRWVIEAGLADGVAALEDRPIEISPLYAMNEEEFAEKTHTIPEADSLLFEGK